MRQNEKKIINISGTNFACSITLYLFTFSIQQLKFIYLRKHAKKKKSF